VTPWIARFVLLLRLGGIRKKYHDNRAARHIQTGSGTFSVQLHARIWKEGHTPDFEDFGHQAHLLVLRFSSFLFELDFYAFAFRAASKMYDKIVCFFL
jgi:hypothetical protein